MLENIAGYYESASNCFRRDFETFLGKVHFIIQRLILKMQYILNRMIFIQNVCKLTWVHYTSSYFLINSSGNGLPILLWVWHNYRLIERWVPYIYSVREFWFVIDFFQILRVRNKNSSNDKHLQFLDKLGYIIFMHTHEQQNRHA